MVKLPILYTHIYCIIRNKIENRTGEISITHKDFRVLLSRPFMINKETSKIILQDMKRYGYIKSDSKDRIVLTKIAEKEPLYVSVMFLKEKGLI